MPAPLPEQEGEETRPHEAESEGAYRKTAPPKLDVDDPIPVDGPSGASTRRAGRAILRHGVFTAWPG